MHAAIRARNLSKSFGALNAVRGVDLEVPIGATYGLIGENGAGKTTFIKLLLGICRPTAGEVRIFDARPDDVAARRRIGYLPERLNLPPSFSALQFLASVGRMKGLSRDALHREIPRRLEEVGLERSAWKRKCATFSKGMRQRTGLAAALMGSPELLILDEPTDGIDPMGRAQIRQVIQNAARAGSTIFLNSHLLAETERICDFVAILSQGRVIKAGPLRALRDEHSHRIVFVPQAGLAQAAEQAGFVPDTASSGEAAAYRMDDADPAALSRALLTLLAAGYQVIEVAPQLRDLESVLTEAISHTAAAENQGAP